MIMLLFDCGLHLPVTFRLDSTTPYDILWVVGISDFNRLKACYRCFSKHSVRNQHFNTTVMGGTTQWPIVSDVE